ncbi:D-lactate dehydrogenase [Nitrosospira sp. Nl5]|uniref:FAD-binding oxidoreductase n=1 Tax=Nitrosospira sp. Nl5 TaxID=200120 RepID=UPI00088F0535|nr:FAD-linked oxidase C-terminal domain-containing protein [Nitrosospira sp. Nl5]SCY75191.1 D-lactate dehydrogenase [Nitrosospira sp. Nl5]
MLPISFITQLGNLLPPERLLTDPVDCYAYAYDNSRKIFPPGAVAFPITSAEVQGIVALCNGYEIPLTPRGRGTGTSGGSLPEQGGVALSLERMLRIISVDPANRVIVAEPGVLNQSVQDAAKPHGFFWPPDPSSAAYSSIGGNLATSAGGPHAVKYGTTRDHVLGLKAVTGGGELIKTGCYTTKGVVGYDLTRLLIGSEGTLAVITEATLKLTSLPQTRAGLIAYYRDARSCASAIVQIMALPQGPSALEFLDAGSLDLIRRRSPDMLPPNALAMLMIEVDGAFSYIAESRAVILAACRNTGLIHAEEAADASALWRARKTLSPLLRDIAPKKINEDVVVPVSALPEFLDGLAQLSNKYRIANINFGHAGNGNIHVNLLVNPDIADEMDRAERCLNEIFDLVIGLNGTLSGEHGVGSEKRAYIGKEIDAPTLALMKEIKRVFDPRNILNPGKLFP